MDLSYNRFRKMPQHINVLTWLHCLDFSRNLITEYSKFIGVNNELELSEYTDGLYYSAEALRVSALDDVEQQLKDALGI